jgi:HEPN domain-containing protein
MMELAESVNATTPGAAGLAYQAAELAVHVMMMELDGYDPWDDGKRYQRASEVLGISQRDIAFLHQVRMGDFYANAARVDTDSGIGWGPPLEAPDDDDCRRCVLTARRVVDAVHARLGPPRQ